MINEFKRLGYDVIPSYVNDHCFIIDLSRVSYKLNSELIRQRCLAIDLLINLRPGDTSRLLVIDTDLLGGPTASPQDFVNYAMEIDLVIHLLLLDEN